MTTLLRCISMLTLVASLWACGDSSHAVDPVWNKQPCAHCHMLVSDPRFAAQLITRSGERLHFDDVGCMAAYLAKNGAVQSAWVHQGAGWVLARAARYAPGVETPMGFGFVADSRGPLDFVAMQVAVAEKAERGALR